MKLPYLCSWDSNRSQWDGEGIGLPSVHDKQRISTQKVDRWPVRTQVGVNRV